MKDIFVPAGSKFLKRRFTISIMDEGTAEELYKARFFCKVTRTEPNHIWCTVPCPFEPVRHAYSSQWPLKWLRSVGGGHEPHELPSFVSVAQTVLATGPGVRLSKWECVSPPLANICDKRGESRLKPVIYWLSAERQIGNGNVDGLLIILLTHQHSEVTNMQHFQIGVWLCIPRRLHFRVALHQSR